MRVPQRCGDLITYSHRNDFPPEPPRRNSPPFIEPQSHSPDSQQRIKASHGHREAEGFQGLRNKGAQIEMSTISEGMGDDVGQGVWARSGSLSLEELAFLLKSLKVSLVPHIGALVGRT